MGKSTSKYTGKYPAPKKYLEKGDKGTGVKYLQEYLNWYTDGEFFAKCGKADGIYGKNTLTYVKKMQTDFFGVKAADGKVGAKTIAKMKEIGNKNPSPAPTPTPTPTPSDKYKVMDISAWQDKISVAEYQKAINYGIKAVILRVGYTGSSSKAPTIDKVFENNYANAIAAGLPVGIYYYSLATSVAKAEKEANWVVSKLKGRRITYPVYIDMEDNATQGKQSKSTLAVVCNTFCNIVGAAGYTPGVYASTSWFNSKIGNITAPHTKWVAQYYNKCEYKGAYDMWQYTSSENVPGIVSKTDVSWCYKNFNIAPQPTKSVDEVAKEVLEGKWGAGTTRKNNLINAGYDYDAVQKVVTQMVEAAAELEAKLKAEAEEKARLEEEAKAKAEAEKLAQTEQQQLEPVVKPEPVVENKSIHDIAIDVIYGVYGSGDARKANLEAAGYDYYLVQAEVNKILNTREGKIAGMLSWSKKIADSGKYKYKKWVSSDTKTHQCPVCHNLTGKYKGWNCIGYAWASWKHGAGLPINCSCSTIDDGGYNKILKASDEDALKKARKSVGISQIQVIRNGGKTLPASMLQPGDVVAYYKGDSYFHTVLYIGNGKIAESNTTTPNITYNKKKYNSSYGKVAFRYVGE